MQLSESTLRFIHDHRRDDVHTLALQAARYPEVSMPEVLTQIAGWQTLRDKVPSWAAVEDLLYPPHLPLEQCSSERTALYKAFLLPPGDTFTDLTGGFGIDCAFLATRFRQATYVERQDILCDLAQHNFPLLGLTHIQICHTDSTEYLRQMDPVDCIYLDPARRDHHGGKTVAIADCEPDVSALEPLLLDKARRVLVKLSPMLDITLALRDLHYVQSVHIVSVANECKELLFMLEQTAESIQPDDIPLHCINLLPDGSTQTVVITRRQEQENNYLLTSTPETWLYEPNTSLLKAGAFRSISSIYKVKKLHPSSHLYTSAERVTYFPGRTFRITGWCNFNKREIKTLLSNEQKANITVRNFPSTVAELRRRLKLSDGGDSYLFATTIGNDKKILIRCVRE